MLSDLGRIDRFGQVLLKPSGFASPNVFFHAVAAEGNAPKRITFAQNSHQLGSGEIRQAQIADYKIECLTPSQGESCCSSSSAFHQMTFMPQNHFEDLTSIVVVFDQENSEAGAGRIRSESFRGWSRRRRRFPHNLAKETVPRSRRSVKGGFMFNYTFIADRVLDLFGTVLNSSKKMIRRPTR